MYLACIRFNILLLIVLVGLSVACSSSYQIQERKATQTTLDKSLTDNAAVTATIAPYKLKLEAQMKDTIGFAARDIEKGGNMAPIGYFTSDLLLAAGRRNLDSTLQLALINQGGLRVMLPKGYITVGKIYEVMPFDNMVATCTITGAQLDSVAASIAGGKDIVMTGVTIKGVGGKLTSLAVNGKPVQPDAVYKLVTIDYLMDGGSNMRILKKAENRKNTGIFLRDFMIEHIRHVTKAGKQLDVTVDKRIELQ